MSDNVTAQIILEALCAQYKSTDPNEWIVLPELRIGSGFGPDAKSRIDLWVMNAYPCKDMIKIAYEIKVTRSDFLKELKSPDKRRWALNYSNRFYFATPEGLIKSRELPPECGLIEYANGKLTIKVGPQQRDCVAPSWGFVASIARRRKS